MVAHLLFQLPDALTINNNINFIPNGIKNNTRIALWAVAKFFLLLKFETISHNGKQKFTLQIYLPVKIFIFYGISTNCSWNLYFRKLILKCFHVLNFFKHNNSRVSYSYVANRCLIYQWKGLEAELYLFVQPNIFVAVGRKGFRETVT